MKALVTGGAGFIGSHVVDRLVARGDSVVVLDNLDPQVHSSDEPEHLMASPAARTALENGALRFVYADVRDSKRVADVLHSDVDAVIHLAATVGVGQSMYRPSYYTATNVHGQGVLMEQMLEHRNSIRRFIVASSMSLYGEGAYTCACLGADHLIQPTWTRDISHLRAGVFDLRCPACGSAAVPAPTPETKPAHATSVYALTKKQQEELALCWGAAYDVPTIALRFFNVYGSRQSLGNPYTGVAAIFMARLKTGRRPEIFEDGDQTRDFIHVFDVADAVIAALDAPPECSGIFNVATGTGTRVSALARMLGRALDTDIEPEILGKYRKGDIRSCIGDPTRLSTTLNWRPRVPFEDGLAELIAWSDCTTAVDRTGTARAELERAGLVA